MGVLSLLLVSVIVALSAHEIQGTKLTYYWVVYENDFRPLGTEAQLATCSGTVLARTSKRFADRIAMEGSGYLKDGTVLNLSSCVSGGNPCRPKNGKYSCFDKVSAPLGSQGNALVPFVSIAANDIPFGTTAILSELRGKKLPNGKTHNGCVRVDDTCSTCNHGDWIDFYVLRNKYYKSLNKKVRLSNVKLTREKCTPQRYV